MILESSIQLWVDEEERIVSFHPVPGFRCQSFTSRDEMLIYVTTALDGKGYRFQ